MGLLCVLLGHYGADGYSLPLPKDMLCIQVLPWMPTAYPLKREYIYIYIFFLPLQKVVLEDDFWIRSSLVYHLCPNSLEG